MWLLYRLWKDLQLLQGRRRRLHWVASGIHIGRTDGDHVLHPAFDLVHLEISDGLLVVPFRVGRRNREVLAVMCERRLRPAFEDYGYRLLEGLAVTLLVLDRCAVRAAQSLVLTRLVAAAHAALDTSAADHV